MQERARRGSDGCVAHLRGPPGSGDDRRDARRLRRARGRTEVLGIGDAVEEHDDRVLGEREIGEIALGQLADPRGLGGRPDPSEDSLMIRGEGVELGARDGAHRHLGRRGRVEECAEPLGGLRGSCDQDLLGDPRPDRLGHGASPGHDGVRRVGRTPGFARAAHASTATARHPIPSPTSPNPSGLVAFTETRVTSTPITSASVSRISSRRGAMAGSEQITVRSQLDGVRPAPATIRTTPARSSEPAIDATAGSVSGKCSPTSPRAAAPSSASAIA